jgi:transposase InsO family protein
MAGEFSTLEIGGFWDGHTPKTPPFVVPIRDRSYVQECCVQHSLNLKMSGTERTYTYQFAFRHDWHSMADVRAAMPDFHRWYNHERRHSALGYATPWSTLTSSANARNAA